MAHGVMGRMLPCRPAGGRLEVMGGVPGEALALAAIAVSVVSSHIHANAQNSGMHSADMRLCA